MKRKAVLMILDGWGIAKDKAVSAVDLAHTPFMDGLLGNYPNAQLEASGLAVGLPEGQMGNSEVGHTNLGAGRVVYQDLVKISLAAQEGTLADNSGWLRTVDYCKSGNKPLHLMGLVSNGGVHSHTEHLYALLRLARAAGIERVFVHAFTDGRDTDPKSGLGFLQDLLKVCSETGAQLATVTGRYFAMDRDKRWERVSKAYRALVNGAGTPCTDFLQALNDSYAAGVTDEFLEPLVGVDDAGKPIGMIQEDDAVLVFNFRTDRCREITQALSQQDFHEQNMYKMNLYYVTMARYDESFTNVHIIYEKDNLTMTMGEALEKAGKNQIRAAETEKYPHVTFFFSGGREEPFKGEVRIMAASPKVATYDLQPEMSAQELTDKVCAELKKGEADFMCLNFANPDMVGHTGVYDAVVKAVETVDSCVKQVVETGLPLGFSFIIIADHGNADYVINADGSPNTAHTTNPVPCFLIDNDYKAIKNGKLGDIAPTILKMMGVEIPADMTGEVLV